jgi:hypothetical protein
MRWKYNIKIPFAVSVLLGCGAVSSGDRCLEFTDNVVASFSRVKCPFRIKMS